MHGVDGQLSIFHCHCYWYVFACMCMSRAQTECILHTVIGLYWLRGSRMREREREKGKRWKRPWPWALKFCCIPVHWLQGQTFNVNYMYHVIYWHFRFFTQKPFLYIWLSNYYYRTYELYKIACAFVSLSFLFLTCLFLQHSNGNSNGKFKTTNFLGHGLQNWNACICDCADNGFRCMQRQTTTTGRYWRTK